MLFSFWLYYCSRVVMCLIRRIPWLFCASVVVVFFYPLITRRTTVIWILSVTPKVCLIKACVQHDAVESRGVPNREAAFGPLEMNSERALWDPSHEVRLFVLLHFLLR